MKNTIFVVAIMIIFTSCNQKNNNMERYDFELVKKMEASDALNKQIVQKGDTFIYISTMDQSGAYYQEYLHTPTFYMTRKDFYSNGILRSKGKVMGNRLWIGIWQFYDQRGNLIKEVDEDGKFGAIKPEQILQFLDKKGHINLKTGDGLPHIVFSEEQPSQPSYPNDGRLSIVFVPQIGAEETPNFIDSFEEEDKKELKREYPYFYVTVRGDQSNGYRRTVYLIHGETGKILETKEETDPAYYI